jgi:NhaP-type Na+/H+ or K+/H+ antiporter
MQVLFEALTDPAMSTPALATVFFIKVCFVSPAIGALIGLVCVAALTVLNRRVEREDHTLQLILTICTGYLSFFVAQYMLNVSGVISCCSAIPTSKNRVGNCC